MTASTIDRAEQRSIWRWFPWLIWGALGFVVVVNFFMAYLALHTFPGIASDDVFDRSNAYDKVLAAAEHQAALGWAMSITVDAARPTITLRDHAGAPIEGARIAVVAQRPLGAEDTAKLTFHATAPGRYTADTALALPGQWELLISAVAEHQTWRAAQRIVVPVKFILPPPPRGEGRGGGRHESKRFFLKKAAKTFYPFRLDT